MKNYLIIILTLTFFLSLTATEKKRFTKSIHIPEGKDIELTSEVGMNVKMQSWDKDSVYIDLYVRIKSSDKDYEKSYIDEFEIDIWENTSEVEITIEDSDEEMNTSFWDIITFKFIRSVEIEIKGEIFIPTKNALLAKVRYSDITLNDMIEEISIDGRGNELVLENCLNINKINNEYGNIKLRETAGINLQISSRSSDLYVENHKGNLFVDAPYANIEASKIDGNLTVESRSGEVNIKDVIGDLEINADYANLEVENISGKSIINTRSSKSRFKDIGAIKFIGPYSNLSINSMENEQSNLTSFIENRSGTIYLYDVKSSVEIEDEYSEIKLRNIVGDIKLNSKSNDITCVNLEGEWSSNTEYCNLNLTEIKTDKVFIKNRSGKVSVQVLNIPTEIKIENQYESINLEIPNNYVGRYNLECKYGEIFSNLGHNKLRGESTAIAEGNIGESSNSIEIKSRSGDIRFNKSEEIFK